MAGLLVITALLAGCGGSASTGDVTLAEADVAYAEPLVDNMLAGIKDKDYAEFSRDMTDTMKSSMNEDSFNSLVELLASKVGEYESRSFGQAANTTQNGVQYTVIIYTAKYSDEPDDVLINVILSGEKKIDGLYFNSPKLSEQ